MTNLEKVRLIIDDKSGFEFTDAEINHFFSEVNSVNYVVYNLIGIIIIRLRKQLLESDNTGAEQTGLSPLRDRLSVLKNMYDKYKDLYENESGESYGKYISSVKPSVAGGDF